MLDHPTDNRLVSVVVPLYNGGKYIESTLRSILSQTYDNYEILVVNDGSTDDGPSIVTMLMEKHPGYIRLLHHPDHGNHWIAASRNLAIRNSKGAFIAFIDQDDLWLPDKLRKQMEALLLHPEAALVYAKSAFINQEGLEKLARGIHPTGGRGIAGEPRWVFDRIIKENSIPTLTVLVRKCCLDRVGLLDEDSRFEFEDWLLFSRVAFFYKIIFIPEILAQYRMHDNNYSTHLFDAGMLFHAEEHYTVTLFSFLTKQDQVSYDVVRKYLRRRIWFFFLRSRSWGISSEMLEKHTLHLLNLFPLERRAILTAFRAIRFLHPQLASLLRRFRRRMVGQ